MSIRLVTFSGETVVPMNDAIVYDSAINQCGIFYGCNVTASGNTIYVDGGYGMIRGRFFEITSSEITVTLSTSGTLNGRLYVHMDLSNTSTPVSLLTETATTLSTLTQEDDANFTNGVWEMEMATFTIDTSEISGLTETFETITDNQTLFASMQTDVDKKIQGITAGRVLTPTYTSTTVSGAKIYTFTASKTGWLVAYATANNGLSLAPYMEARDSNNVPFCANWGVTASGSAIYTYGPLLAGKTYHVRCVRCTLGFIHIHY